MRKFKNKDTMNTLLNIDNVFGEYEGRVLPIVLTLLLAAAPPLVWLFFLRGTFIKLWYVIAFDVVWGGLWALQILGHGKQRMQFYLEQRNNEYKVIDQLVHINHIHDDGLIEYSNGVVAYLVSGYLKSYLNDKACAKALQNFMDELDIWEWDLYYHNTIDEVLTTSGLPNLVRYEDKQVIEERIEFYEYQDEYARGHSSLYRYTFMVRTGKVAWKRMKTHLEELIVSDTALCFNEIQICNKHEVNELANRDVCGFIDLNKMLLSKYDNNQFYGSQVLYYDDQIPEELLKDKDISDLSERRISE